MKYLIFLLYSSIVFSFSSNIKPVADQPFVMVQLFTSFGCSYCPPADELISKVKEEYKGQEVYVLSYHVDYWNRTGWKDPFSKKSFTELQNNYAKQFKQRRVYTPQVVVNGKDYFNGSNKSKLKKKIRSYLKKGAKNKIKLSYSKNSKGNLALNYEVNGNLENKKLKIAFVLKDKKLKKGNNNSRLIPNTNIVLQEMMIELLTEPKGSVLIPKITSEIKGDLIVIGYIQNKKLEITGATQLEF